MSMLVTGYYYSIQGDRYLQQNWKLVKDAMEKATVKAADKAADKAAIGSLPKAAAKPTAKTKTAAQTEAAATPTTQAKPAVKAEAAAKTKAAVSPPAPLIKAAAPPVVAPVEPPPSPAPVPLMPPAPLKTAPPLKTPVKTAAPLKAPVKAALRAPVRRASPRFSPARPPRPAPPAGGSVSDRLRKLSGRDYDLYQDRFLAHARPAIRKILGSGRGIFFSLPEMAEDLVYYYLQNHYADPYMNWPESGERRQLADQGFNLPSLDPVIDECFRKISRE
jgi:hypothetical protein